MAKQIFDSDNRILPSIGFLKSEFSVQRPWRNSFFIVFTKSRYRYLPAFIKFLKSLSQKVGSKSLLSMFRIHCQTTDQFLLREKSRTPMIASSFLTHNACFFAMNFNTVCSCSAMRSSVSSPGKFQLTFLTSCIHELILELSPNPISTSLTSVRNQLSQVIIPQI